MRKILTAALAMACIAGPVLAQPAPATAPRRDMFDLLDTNKDNILSKQEYMQQSEQSFANMDTNSDGMVDAAEREAQRVKWRSLVVTRTPVPSSIAGATSATPAAPAAPAAP
jgi:hypothetical protein